VLPSSKRAADVILVAACVVQLLTIRDGQPWGDDFAQYITHARNLIERRPYADIGVLRAGQIPGPLEYPPVYPLGSLARAMTLRYAHLSRSHLQQAVKQLDDASGAPR
jgi:hypothetical protein